MEGTGRIEVHLFDGRRQPLPTREAPLIQVLSRTLRRRALQWEKKNVFLTPELSVVDSPDDDCSVVAATKGYKDAGAFPVRLEAGQNKRVSLMQVRHEARFSFPKATWDQLPAKWPAVVRFLRGEDPAGAPDHYAQLMEDHPECLGCFWNILAAVKTLPIGDTLLGLFRQIDLVKEEDNRQKRGLNQDRFFAYADPQMRTIIDSHTKGRPGNDPKIFEPADVSLHPGADHSVKEVRFGEANLQITFHSQTRRMIGGVDCMVVELDMDYYQDPLSHFFLEVIPNAAAQAVGKAGRTDPLKIYAMRWMADPANFDPPLVVDA